MTSRHEIRPKFHKKKGFLPRAPPDCLMWIFILETQKTGIQTICFKSNRPLFNSSKYLACDQFPFWETSTLPRPRLSWGIIDAKSDSSKFATTTYQHETRGNYQYIQFTGSIWMLKKHPSWGFILMAVSQLSSNTWDREQPLSHVLKISKDWIFQKTSCTSVWI